MIVRVIDIFSVHSNKWICKFPGWHRAPILQEFDGSSKNGTCPRCGKHIMLDGQGNWF